MTSDSLLAHLAWRFPGATEDIATEALLYILRRQEGARTALADLLRSGGAHPEPMDSFDTQRVYQRSKKPDLVAFNKGREVLLVESKFWASLTSHQPIGYLRLMMDDLPDTRNLLFIAPVARQEGLWEELREQAGKQFQVTGEQAADGVRSAAVGSGGHRLMLTSWDTLVDRLDSSGPDEVGDLRQLRGLCAPASDDARLASGDAENLGEVDHYKTFLADAVALAESRGVISTGGLSYGGGSGGYGRYFRFVNAGDEEIAVAWIGFNFARTESLFFLWLVPDTGQFSADRMDEIRAQLEGVFDGHGHVSIPISATAGYAYVREGVVSKLQEIRNRIAGLWVGHLDKKPLRSRNHEHGSDLSAARPGAVDSNCTVVGASLIR